MLTLPRSMSRPSLRPRIITTIARKLQVTSHAKSHSQIPVFPTSSPSSRRSTTFHSAQPQAPAAVAPRLARRPSPPLLEPRAASGRRRPRRHVRLVGSSRRWSSRSQSQSWSRSQKRTKTRSRPRKTTRMRRARIMMRGRPRQSSRSKNSPATTTFARRGWTLSSQKLIVLICSPLDVSHVSAVWKGQRGRDDQ